MRGLAVIALFVAVSATSYGMMAWAESTPAAAPESPPLAAPAAAPVVASDKPAATAAVEVPAYAFEERFMGMSNAPLTIYEYAQLTCPHCAHLHTGAMIEIKKHYVDTGLVKIVFRDFPFDETAMKAAAAARCVPPEGYFSFINALFMQQDVWVHATDPLAYVKQLSGMAGVTPELFDKCITDKKLTDHLLAGQVEGSNKYSVNSTPTFVFEDGIQKMVGAQEFSQYAVAIDAKLKEKGVKLPEAAPAVPAEEKKE